MTVKIADGIDFAALARYAQKPEVDDREKPCFGTMLILPNKC